MKFQTLAEKRVLVVEDDYFLMGVLCHDLRDVGVVVIGPVPSVHKGLALILAEPGIDAAILDVNLQGDMAYPIADALAARAIPFIFLTGYTNGILRTRYPKIPILTKPSHFALVAETLMAEIGACGARAADTPSNSRSQT